VLIVYARDESDPSVIVATDLCNLGKLFTDYVESNRDGEVPMDDDTFSIVLASLERDILEGRVTNLPILNCAWVTEYTSGG